MRDLLGLADQISTLVEIVSKKVVTPATVKAVKESCVTCGSAHAWYNCPNTDNNQSSVCAATGTYNQVAPPNRVSNHMAPPGFCSEQTMVIYRFALTIKNLLINKEKLFELAKIPLNDNCSAMLLKKLPKKLGDPGNFGEVLRFKKSNHFLSDSTTPFSDSHPSFTSFETSDSLLEEFADELALLDPFPLRNEDVDFEAEIREIDFLLNTPLFDEDECFDPGSEIDKIDAFMDAYNESEGDVLEILHNTTHNLFPEVFFDHEP
ncbi:hypothetical protein Tco_0946508 [Tanacetum coccineum]